MEVIIEDSELEDATEELNAIISEASKIGDMVQDLYKQLQNLEREMHQISNRAREYKESE